MREGGEKEGRAANSAFRLRSLRRSSVGTREAAAGAAAVGVLILPVVAA